MQHRSNICVLDSFISSNIYLVVRISFLKVCVYLFTIRNLVILLVSSNFRSMLLSFVFTNFRSLCLEKKLLKKDNYA